MMGAFRMVPFMGALADSSLPSTLLQVAVIHHRTAASLSPPPLLSTRRVFLTSLPMSTVLLTFAAPPLLLAAPPLPTYDPVTSSERDASSVLQRRVAEAVELLDKGREFQAKGEFSNALECFSQVATNYKDFAFSDYARVGRALALYELGDRDEAIIEMEDVSISLKGYPEVHAALAAALYADKHAPLLAENQFTIATLMDARYTDLSYVRDTKHWPPSLVASLQRFITLS
ncbi:uncharacterized protein LOC116267096 [Nymphaea colorata]|nr:uncharacterized protein LOC116267096 [Nymphaea colorata]